MNDLVNGLGFLGLIALIIFFGTPIVALAWDWWKHESRR
jgi:hypothetical protein